MAVVGQVADEVSPRDCRAPCAWAGGVPGVVRDGRRYFPGGWERARLKAELLGAGRALGLLQQAPAAWFARGASGEDDARIQALVDERAAAKRARDFARADAIRAELAEWGVLLEDGPGGTTWRRG